MLEKHYCYSYAILIESIECCFNLEIKLTTASKNKTNQKIGHNENMRTSRQFKSRGNTVKLKGGEMNSCSEIPLKKTEFLIPSLM